MFCEHVKLNVQIINKRDYAPTIVHLWTLHFLLYFFSSNPIEINIEKNLRKMFF